MALRIGKIASVQVVEEFWTVTLRDIEYEVSVGQTVEQLRNDESLMIWEVLGEQGSTLILSPTGAHAPNGIPIATNNDPDLKPGDQLDISIGGRSSRLGLGDVIANMTKAMGIKPCAGCEERRKRLNRLFPNITKG